MVNSGLGRVAVAAALIMAGGVLAGRRAQAQEVPPDAAAAGARALFEQGVALTQAGDWAQAAERFRQAFALRNSPVIEYNLANALAETGHLLRAAEILNRTKDAADAPENVRRQSRDLLTQIEERLAIVVVRVEGSAEGTSLRVDDVEREAGAPLRLEAGAHRIALMRGSAVMDERREELPAGRTEVTLRAPAPVVAPTQPPVPAISSSAPTEPTRDTELPTWPIVLGSAGLAICVGGLVGFLSYDGAVNDYEDRLAAHDCGTATEDPDCALYEETASNEVQQAKDWKTLSIVGMAAGGALLGAGAVLWLLDSDDGDDSASVACSPTFTGLQCAARF